MAFMKFYTFESLNMWGFYPHPFSVHHAAPYLHLDFHLPCQSSTKNSTPGCTVAASNPGGVQSDMFEAEKEKKKTQFVRVGSIYE